MGLLLFIQPKKESSFALAGSLWLLGWFGIIHGANEFMDMWSLLRRPQSPAFAIAKLSALLLSFAFLLEFGRRSLNALETEKPGCIPGASILLGWWLLPALLLLTILPAALSGDFQGAAPGLSRLLLCFPGALLAGLAFLGYSKCRESTLGRLKAKMYFILAGAAFIAYALLSGLVPPESAHFPANLFNTGMFLSAVGLPVQLFRSACAAVIFGAVLGAMRIFREGALQEAQQELLDIIEFFPDATFVIDRDKKVIAWNRALELMTGVPKREMLGKGDFAYSLPFYGVRRPILIDLIGAASSETEKLYDYVRKRTDGTIYAEVFVPSLYGGTGAHVWVTSSPLLDKEGNIYGAIESVRDVTDRKLAEEALHQSEAQYRALIETTNTGFLIIDKEGKVLDANQEYARLTGHKSLAEIRGRPVFDWTAGYEKEKNAAAIEKCARDGNIRNFEIDYADRNGRITPVELNATVVEIAGEPRILTLCRDITERRQAEKLLKESEGKFRALTERSLVGVYLIQDGLFRYVNPKLAEIFGYGEGELTDKKGPKDLVLPEDWPIVGENLRKRLDGESSDINYAFRGIKKDGTRIEVEVYGSRSEYLGRPAVLGTLLEITERKKSQDALGESEERYRTLVNNAQVGIVVHKLGVMRFVNRKMAEIVRVPGFKELIGRNVLEFMHPDYKEFVKARILNSMRDGKPLPPTEEKLVAADGTVLDVEINAAMITYEGEPCSLAIVQDITARKKAEADLKAAHLQLLAVNAGLERRVEERTAELEEVNKELEAFSYSAAHDLKAPLRRLNIFSEMLEKEAGTALKGEPRGYLSNIHKSVTLMTQLVDGLLELSTMGKKPLSIETVQLSGLLGEVMAEIKAEHPGRDIDWVVHKLPEAGCDRAMLRQVFTNLLGNAVKYSRGRSPARVEVFSETAGLENVIGVRDNGVGFSMEYAHRLFGVFQRLHRAEEFPGTGIGLSTVKRIISRHGGRVWAESSPGKGAVFYFSLPIVR